MADNLGTGVSHVFTGSGYNYDTVVFQKGKPPLDSEVNLVQQLQMLINQKQLSWLNSGWLTMREVHTDTLLSNQFYTQNPTDAIPEYAVINGHVVYVTGTNTQTPNANLINLGTAPLTGNRINGVFLEVWRALLSPNSSTNKPSPITIIDALNDVEAVDSSFAWAVGDNGVVLNTQNSGVNWSVQAVDTKQNLRGVSFANRTIGWAVGNSGTVIRTSSGGVRWTVLSTGFIENLNAIHAISQLQAWAVGNSGTVLKTSNGVTFVSLPSGVTANLNGVFFYDAQTGWVVGNSGTILKTTNGGSSWISVNSGTTAKLNSVTFYDLSTGFAVGDGGVLLITTNGGSTWSSQSGNMWDGLSYSTVTDSLYDLHMSPGLDDYVDGEEVTSQFDGTNKNCTVSRVPVTTGNGTGTTTNVPSDIVVRVNGTAVPVDTLNGTSGSIILHNAPALGNTVKVYYYCRVPTGAFRGRVWAVGANGVVLRSDDVGAHWTRQTSNTGYPLRGISFVDLTKGWTVGDFSTIRHSVYGGDNWGTQQSDAVTRQVQRVYSEGNISTMSYLEDDAIHPDTNIETSKRVQVQYKIRYADGADPNSFPEAGLGSSAIVGLGPNATGQYAFENMGPVTGDYGLWRAKCTNTVDGYCYAIPMFFVARRNTTSYSSTANANGEYKANTAIRPDLLTAAMITSGDILDVRRRSVIPALAEMVSKNTDLLLSNNLRTNLSRDSVGGDKYGTTLLQVDRVGAGTQGENINGSTLALAVGGGITSSVTVTDILQSFSAGAAIPPPVTFLPQSGTGSYHTDPSYYSALYVGPNSVNNGKKIPGTWSGVGTNEVTFTFSPFTVTTDTDVNLVSFDIKAPWVSTSSPSLKHISAEPHLVSNNGATQSFYFQGVNEGSTKEIEKWDSGISGYPNYAVAHGSVLSTLASTIEVHSFIKITSAMISTKVTTNDTLEIDRLYGPGGSYYSVRNINKLNNLDGAFSYKITNQVVGNTSIKVSTVSYMPFVAGTTVEIIAMVVGDTGTNIRNGASVNFLPQSRGLGNFYMSSYDSTTLGNAATYIDITTAQSGVVVGTGHTETPVLPVDPICWVDSTQVRCAVSGLNTSTVRLSFRDNYNNPIMLGSNTSVAAQLLVNLNALPYDNDGTDNLLIGYSYVPYQTVSSLPVTTTVEVMSHTGNMYVSNIGSGGGAAGYPYSSPTQNIPVNDITIASDNEFFNDGLMFDKFSVDTGFVQLPIYVPGSPSEYITLSGVSTDLMGRTFYNTCSKEMRYYSEALAKETNRRVFLVFVVRVRSASDNKFLPGENLLMVMSRTTKAVENVTGYIPNDTCAISLYRMPNKPLTRV